MEMYLIASGRVATRLIDRLVAAARRGVSAQVLLDGFGALGLSAADRRRLIDGGVHLVFFNPPRLVRLEQNLFRSHRKLLLVDDEAAFVGGAGITDEFDGEQGWRETVVEARGPVAGDWLAVFVEDWRHWADQDRGMEIRHPPALPDGLKGRVAINRGAGRGEIKRNLVVRMRRARDRVWLATAYFIPSRKLRRALRRCARRGLDVRLVLPGPVADHPAVRYASHRYYARLLRHGVRIFEYQDRFMHSKVGLVDDWVSIGSSNLDRWNLHWNLEANQEILSTRFADQVQHMLETDMGNCLEIRYESWRERSCLQRCKEWFWGGLDLRLARWSATHRYRPPHKPGK